jgi:hypothetical protein
MLAAAVGELAAKLGVVHWKENYGKPYINIKFFDPAPFFVA